MSTPTPIEIVREHQRWRRAQGQYAGLCQCPHTPEEIGLALDSVLRDAERFQLQQWQPIETAPAKDCLLYQPEGKGRSPLTARMLVERGNDRRARETTHWMPLPPPPAELADRLKGAK